MPALPELQHLTVRFDTERTLGSVVLAQGIFAEENSCASISQAGISAISVSVRNEEMRRTVFLLGSPLLPGSDRVDRPAAAKALSQASDLAACVSTLNGEFLALIFDEGAQSLSIFTDRFASYPLYWAFDGKIFAGSYLYTDLARYCRSWSGFRLRPEKAYEFFILQRMMNEGTHDTLTQGLKPATQLTVDRNGVRQARYWFPDYIKAESASSAELVEKFTGLVQTSVRSRLKDVQGGIFLSGGHDSRLVALCADTPVTCYTLGFSDNFEVGCARDIARAVGQKHEFVHLEPDYFEKTLDQAAYLSGGMYATDHALFFPQGKDTRYADVLLHGHGLDYMFQGMYLHAQPYKFLGRPTYLKHMTDFPMDVIGHYIDQISYRLKFPLNQTLGSVRVKEYGESLYSEVSRTVTQGRVFGISDKSSLWDYLILHQISRHYTFTNVMSKRLCGEVRTPSLDNDLYNFYLALPDKFRLHADMMRGAMYRLNPAVAEIPAGNYGIAAGWGPWKKTAALIGRKVMRDITGKKRYHAPGDNDRTWPGRNDYLKAHAAYREAALAPLQDKEFQDFLDFIDWDKLNQLKSGLLDQDYGGAFWVSMLTYYRFYKNLYA